MDNDILIVFLSGALIGFGILITYLLTTLSEHEEQLKSLHETVISLIRDLEATGAKNVYLKKESTST